MTSLLLAIALSAEPPTPVKDAPKPAAKKTSLFRKKSDGAAVKPKDDDKPPSVPDRPIPKPDDAPKKGSALDEELAKDLAKNLGVDDEEDPLLRAGQRMRAAEEQFAKAEVGGQTLELQEKIVADLTELLKRAKQNQSKQNQKQNQKQQSQKQQQQQQQQNQQQQAQQQQNQQRQNDKANDASARAQAGRATKEELAKMREQRDVWGHLPELERQLMQQSFKDEMLPEYRAALEKYYKKLAEQAASKDK